jgi:uncharacterized protein HemY
MSASREAMFKQMVTDFPDAPMGWFSLGKLYLEEKRWAESAQALEKAVSLDKNYAAAWVALGDAFASAGNADKARHAWNQALETPLGKRDMSLQGDLEQRLRELD